MSKVVRFEIPVDDPDRAAGFYRDALGWEISRFGGEPYWLVRARARTRSPVPTARLPAAATYTGAGCGQAKAREPPSRPAQKLLLPATISSRLPFRTTMALLAGDGQEAMLPCNRGLGPPGNQGEVVPARCHPG
jgi:catechol 2,3-dioxygenase-like lactoylglutathione lyase family enzyme